MIRYQDADVALAQMANDPLDIEHRYRIDAGERLVEEHEFRLHRKRTRDLDTATLAAREANPERIANVANVQLFEQLFELRLPRCAVEVPPRLKDSADVVRHAQRPEDRRLLRQVAQAELGAPVHGQPRDVAARQVDAALVAAHEADDHVERSRLAGAVRAEQPHDLAALDR